MDYKAFIESQSEELQKTVGDGVAINALSGGVDSAVCTVLAHRALGRQLRTVFVDNAMMRENEPEEVMRMFADLNIPVELIDARDVFMDALKGLVDPEEKRSAISGTFYRKVFGRLVRESGARFLIHGTILTDIEESVAGYKRQHNILSQLGIDPQEEFGYEVLEPLKTLRKDGVRALARALNMPSAMINRIPFPGPGLAARIVGEVTEERLDTVRKANAIVEEELDGCGAFQYLAALLEDRATGIRDNKREFGQIIVVRSIDSLDAREATATRIPWETLQRICRRIVAIPGVSRCLYDLTPKPPATVEYI